MFRKKKIKDPGDLGGGFYLRLYNDQVKLIRAGGYPFPPEVIKYIQVSNTGDVEDAVYILKELAQDLKDYRTAFDGAL